ncbi:MAG TPA: glycoside hydrolase family 3 C-terminal domain-containing protein [Planosporangium sp.]|nr:glycoside hydrolase family 3 C-terminal domain-containing protein [Planosporangium sp.]
MSARRDIHERRDIHDQVVEKALAALDLETKVSLLSGQDMWSLPAVPAIGLASVVMSDGPIGVRGTAWTPDDPSIALPSPTALAATWDTALARTAGRLLGQEARRKGVHLLLAPTVNMHRSPLGGRHFETYSEDPLLTSEIGAAYVAGVQDQGVGATVKHFVANDSETERLTVDARVGERALREVYLAPFETIVTRAGAWAVMAAYNSVNGTTMTEHDALLNGVLKGEWGFDGIVVSDWFAARSTVGAAAGGLDVAMPARNSPWGDKLVQAVRSGAVAAEIVDEQVRRVLRLAVRVGALNGGPATVAAADRPAPLDGGAVAREVAARSFVLARNSGGLLPLSPATLRRVALIGAAAREARVLGGGSAQVFPPRVVSPLDGLSAALPEGVELAYAVGVDPRTKLLEASGPQWTRGFTAVFRGADGAVLATAPLASGAGLWIGGLPAGVDPATLASVEVTGRLMPETGGGHELAIGGVGRFILTVDGDVHFDGDLAPGSDDPAEGFFLAPERRVPVELAAGRPVEVTLTKQLSTSDDPAMFLALTLGHAEPGPTPDELIEQAVVAAAGADVAIVVVATTLEVESEGFDRDSLALPGRQDELVARVAAANPRTVVVVNTGSPVLMPWADSVSAIVLTWFPGQEAGAALADVLLGAAEPGGRLPTTWPRRAEDCPVLSTTPTDGILRYGEGVFIGYRAWQRAGVEPLFGFGHGLGYTTWAYESLVVEPDAEGVGTAVVTVRNTGDRAGREVVQLYLAPAAPDPERPARWLAGFAVTEAAPGEAATVRIPVPRRAVQVWDGGWRTVAGRYAVEAAHSIADRRVAVDIEV